MKELYREHRGEKTKHSPNFTVNVLSSASWRIVSLASQTYFDVPYYDVDWGLVLVLVPSFVVVRYIEVHVPGVTTPGFARQSIMVIHVDFF